MNFPLLNLATFLVAYHLLYYLGLLHVSQGYVVSGLPYGIFHWRLFSGYSPYFRLAFVLSE